MKPFSEPIDHYIELLKAYNAHTNVYSKSAYGKLPFHITDSLQLAEFVGDQAQHIVDMGSGSGLPSVILAIACPNARVTAVESKSRKTRFLEHVKAELGLDNYTVVTGDINQVLNTLKPIDVVTAKAFKPLPDVVKIFRKTKAKQLWVPISDAQRELASSLGEVITGDMLGTWYFHR